LYQAQWDVSTEDRKCATGTQQQSIQKCKNIYFIRLCLQDLDPAFAKIRTYNLPRQK